MTDEEQGKISFETLGCDTCRMITEAMSQGEADEYCINCELKARAKAQDQKTAEQVYKEIGIALEKIMVEVGYMADIYALSQRLKQGLPPEETK